MTVTLPFTLTNGPGQTADADQVMANYNALKTAVDALQAATVVPSGSVFAYAGAAAPTGYLLCDGTAVSRTTYAALFAVLGITYGVGNGSTTFNLPDLRGRVPMGVDGAAARITGSDALGNTGGNQYVSLGEQLVTTGPEKAMNYTNNVSNLQPYQVINYIVRY